MIPSQLYKAHRFTVWVIGFLLLFAGMIQFVSVNEAAARSNLETITKRGILRVGVSPFTPWVFKGKNGEWVGFEIDVAKKLAKDMGVTPKFISYDWEKLIPALNGGEIDIISAGMAITPQRALKVNFSSPYATSGISLATNIERTRHIKSVEELNRKAISIGVISATVSEGFAKRIFNKASIVAFKKSKEAENAIVTGKIHAYLEAKPIPRFIALDHPSKVDVPLSEPLLSTKAGFAINKGDPDFLNFLNSWIVAREADTWLTSTHDYWFKSLKWK
jgi:polar amino acid transport system substrate-binding protein